MILLIVYTSESSCGRGKDCTHNEGHTGDYSGQDPLNDYNKQGSGSNDREVEQHVSYAINCPKPKPISNFSMGSTDFLPPTIAKTWTTQNSTKVLPLSGDPILTTTNDITLKLRTFSIFIIEFLITIYFLQNCFKFFGKILEIVFFL